MKRVCDICGVEFESLGDYKDSVFKDRRCSECNQDNLEEIAYRTELKTIFICDKCIAEKNYHKHKFDQGKTDYSLIPYEVVYELYNPDNKSLWTDVFRDFCEQYDIKALTAIDQVRDVLEYGLRKYGKKNSWQQVPDGKERYMSAMFRHLIDNETGLPYDIDHIDEESGLPSYAHALCNMIFLIWLDLKQSECQ